MINIKTFVQDDGGHWYCIPYTDYKAFLADVENGDGEEWDRYRMNDGVEGIPIVIDWGRDDA